MNEVKITAQHLQDEAYKILHDSGIIIDDKNAIIQLAKRLAISKATGQQQERERAIKCAHYFFEKYDTKAKVLLGINTETSKQIAHFDNQRAEIARCTMNSISGKNALTMNDEDFWVQVINYIKEN